MHNRFQELQQELQEGVSEKKAKELAKFQPEIGMAKKQSKPRLEKRDDKTVVVEPDPFDAEVVQNLLQEMQQGTTASRASEIALNSLGITRFCCRQAMLQQIQLPEGPYHYEEKHQPNTLIIQPSGDVVGDTNIFRQVGVLSSEAQENKKKTSRILLEKRGVRQKSYPASLRSLKPSNEQ
jgi:DNA-directed RNA polymerase subunit N (RpoN/RPB10)